MKERKDIPEKYKWDLSRFCKSEEECWQRLAKVKNSMQDIVKYSDEIKENNTDKIFEMLEFHGNIEHELTVIATYAHLRFCEDARNGKINELVEAISSVGVEYNTLSTFITVGFSKLSDEYLTELKNNKQHWKYNVMFDDIIKEKPHISSEQEEILLSKIGTFLNGTVDVFNNYDNADVKFQDAVDSKGNKHILTNGTYSKLRSSPDRKLRESAFKNLEEGYKNAYNALTANFINSIKENVTLSKIRKFDSCLEESLFASNTSIRVYHKLIEQVRKHINLIHRYYDIKRQILGLDEIAIYDLNATTNQNENLYTYEQAVEIMKKALQPLGEEYLSIVDKVVDNRWIDVYENLGKDSGAFSNSVDGCNPVILLNYGDSFDWVSTLVHEMGHAVHSYLSEKALPEELSNYAIFLAEIASTTNENLLNAYMLKNSTNLQDKIYYLDDFMSLVSGTIYRQTQFAEFEEFAYSYYENNQTLSKDILTNKYTEILNFYMGPNVDKVNEKQFGWIRIPHFYYYFYVYQYATGLISSIIITKRLLSKENGFLEKYIKFLSSGRTKPPVEILKDLGINLEKDAPYEEAFSYIEEQLNNLEKLIKKPKD